MQADESSVHLREAVSNTESQVRSDVCHHSLFAVESVRKKRERRLERRFTALVSDDPFELARSFPEWAARVPVSRMPLSTRCRNVFHAHEIRKVADLSKYTLEEALRWRNFGRKSAAGIAHALRVLVNDDSRRSRKPLARNPSLLACVMEALDSLSERDQMICKARLGVDGHRSTLEELAYKHKVTAERIRQIENRVLESFARDESWPELIGARLNHLFQKQRGRIDLGLLESDSWFAGFSDKHEFFCALVSHFTAEEFRVCRGDGSCVLFRLSRNEDRVSQRA